MPLHSFKIYSAQKNLKLKRPLFITPVSAGFPSPADDYLEGKIDLNQKLITNPTATFYVKVSGNSMIGADIFSGDVLVVDRSKRPGNNNIVIAVIDRDFTVKRLKIIKGKKYLAPENDDYPPIELKPEMDVEIWGVVTYVIHKAQ